MRIFTPIVLYMIKLIFVEQCSASFGAARLKSVQGKFYSLRCAIVWYAFPQNFVNFYRSIQSFYDNNLWSPVVIKPRVLYSDFGQVISKPNSGSDAVDLHKNRCRTAPNRHCKLIYGASTFALWHRTNKMEFRLQPVGIEGMSFRQISIHSL